MTRALSFTVDSLARQIKGAKKGGLHVLGIRPDGTLITGDKPLEATSLIPAIPEHSETPKRRIGDKVHGGAGEG